MNAGCRRLTERARTLISESELMVKRARETVEATRRRLADCRPADPYLAWAQLHPIDTDRAPGHSAIIDETISRVAIAEQLILIARQLMQTSRLRRRLRHPPRRSDAPVRDPDTTAAR